MHPPIRSARPGEGPTLSDLCLRSKAHWGYDGTFLRLCVPALRVSPEAIAAGRVLVAGEADPLGVAAHTAPIATTAELALLFVDPPAMGRGIGAALFATVAARLRTLGARRMTILADPGAAPFYRRMGARPTGEAPSDVLPGRMLPTFAFDLT